jgi:hypothetical protein
MPKDEFDFEDPLELNGVALLTREDTSADMAECFVEEFLRMGYNHKQILALFLNPHYLGMNMVLQNKGEAFVKKVIAETFAKWGKTISWPDVSIQSLSPALSPSEGKRENPPQPTCDGGASVFPKIGETPGVGDCISRAELQERCRGLFPLPLGGGEGATGEQMVARDPGLTDPMGNPIPNLA